MFATIILVTLAYCFISDVDECATSSPCSVNAICSNAPGSYVCVCNPGYTGNGTVCTSEYCLVANQIIVIPWHTKDVVLIVNNIAQSKYERRRQGKGRLMYYSLPGSTENLLDCFPIVKRLTYLQVYSVFVQR